MKLEVKNRFTGAVQFAADIDCADDAPLSLKLGLAIRQAIKTGADLRDAYLRDADLGSADLGGADFGGADLGGADLGEQWIVQGPARSDGYFFTLTSFKDEGVRVKAGCRNFSLAEAREHWGKTRQGTPLGDETFAILDCLEAMAKARGLL